MFNIIFAGVVIIIAYSLLLSLLVDYSNNRKTFFKQSKHYVIFIFVIIFVSCSVLFINFYTIEVRDAAIKDYLKGKYDLVEYSINGDTYKRRYELSVEDKN